MAAIGQVTVQVAPLLRPLLLPRNRKPDRMTVDIDATSSVVHLVESLGIPRTEVGEILVAGNPCPRDYRPQPGDRIEIRPVARPQSGFPARYLLDVHLGTLARRMRLLGLDTAYSPQASDPELVAWANAEGRVLLTRDRGLLRRRAVTAGALVRYDDPDAQLADLLDRFAPEVRPWTRCPTCNGLLEPVSAVEAVFTCNPGLPVPTGTSRGAVRADRSTGGARIRRACRGVWIVRSASWPRSEGGETVHVRFALVVVLLLAGCAAQAPPPAASPTPRAEPTATPSPAPPEPAGADATISRIPPDQWAAMRRAGVVREGCPAGREDLRRVEVNFHDWKGGVERGVLVVNRDVAGDCGAASSPEIFNRRFPIRSDAPDRGSSAATTTRAWPPTTPSAYNCRTAAQANLQRRGLPACQRPRRRHQPAGESLAGSPLRLLHADRHACRPHAPARARSSRAVRSGGRSRKRGWIWQDIATPDYQHFDTGYPSRPWVG